MHVDCGVVEGQSMLTMNAFVIDAQSCIAHTEQELNDCDGLGSVRKVLASTKRLHLVAHCSTVKTPTQKKELSVDAPNEQRYLSVVEVRAD